VKSDQEFMRRALELAALGRGKTSPNPLVGAVVVKDGVIVGEGYHKKAGTPHAEVIALQEAGARAKGADLYVNLEPCCHYGRTPPCTKAIIEAGVKRVVVACEDPNLLVAGKGIEILRQAGIAVEVGVLEEEARRLNEVFFKFITTRRPFVTLKVAMSLDGKIATFAGDSKWITGEQARCYAHQMRAEHDAVMVGIGTVLTDDPLLTVRLPGESKQPWRLIVDSRLRIPLESRIALTSGKFPTIVATVQHQGSREKKKLLEERGIEVWELPADRGRVDLNALLEELGRKEITSVLLEGGATLNASALEAGVVDKFVIFVAPKIIGGSRAPGPIGGLGVERIEDAWLVSNLEFSRVGEDLMITCYPRKNE
jgi:diaminohydroxyphosphoribosylaminopyrimidine deaminase/5-amino-6-(5-phosphoribosylamino)uracil reductase